MYVFTIKHPRLLWNEPRFRQLPHTSFSTYSWVWSSVPSRESRHNCFIHGNEIEKENHGPKHYFAPVLRTLGQRGITYCRNYFLFSGFRSVTTALSFFWGSSVRQGDSKIQYWKKYSDAFCFPPNRITQVMLNSSFLNSSFLKWLPTASFLFPHHSQTKTCIKLKLTESQGPHCFGKVLFVTFVPANRENAGDIHFWPS